MGRELSESAKINCTEKLMNDSNLRLGFRDGRGSEHNLNQRTGKLV